MQLKEGGNPTNKEDWSRPRRVVKKTEVSCVKTEKKSHWI